MKRSLLLFSNLTFFLTAALTSRSDVRVFVRDLDGLAWIHYECNGGEVVRAFALDVTVDQGQILDLNHFFRGESTALAQGYGIFPASFRDHIQVGPGPTIDWNVSGYTPLAVPADFPGETLAGLGTGGVTLEFGALWNPAEPEAVPPPAGVLCALQISQGATVTVQPNVRRGGILSANPDMLLAPVFEGAFVQPAEVTGWSLTDGVLTIAFVGGELETAWAIEGPWNGTGNRSGHYVEMVGNGPMKFYRVNPHQP